MSNRQAELSYFFSVMVDLAAAKAAGDIDALADCVADIEGMAMHSEVARIRRSAEGELERAQALLADLQAKRFGFVGTTVVMTGAGAPANLN